MQERAQRAPFPLPRKKWNVHKSSVSARIDLEEGMIPTAGEMPLTQSVTLGLSYFGYPVHLQTHLY